jgi:hypothetical protein
VRQEDLGTWASTPCFYECRTKTLVVFGVVKRNVEFNLPHFLVLSMVEEIIRKTGRHRVESRSIIGFEAGHIGEIIYFPVVGGR